MDLESLLADDVVLRHKALAECATAADHVRFNVSSEVARVAKATADALATADETGGRTTEHAEKLGRAVLALSMLRGEIAQNCLLRIADERSYAVKSALAKALRATQTAEGKSVLVYLLSDDDAQADALVAIGAAPWPEILPALIEIAEADDRTARLAARSIARCGAIAGSDEANAAASFLLEELDDEMVVLAAADALVRYGTAFVGVADKAKTLVKGDGRRRIAGITLLAATTDFGDDALAALAGKNRPDDEKTAGSFLRPLLDDVNPAVRRTAGRAWRALGLT